MRSIPLPKLKAILRYFCTNTDPRFLGKVKLMKLFYFLDFTHVKRHGAPVTYDTYYNLEHGPIPTLIKNLVDTAADDPDGADLSDTIVVERSDDRLLQRIRCARPFSESDAQYFTPNELEALHAVCERFGAVSTKVIEDASHKEAPWLRTRASEQISYTLATEDPDCEVTKEEIELLLKIQR